MRTAIYIFIFLLVLTLAYLFIQYQSFKDYLPKPKAYHKIDLPEKKYLKGSLSPCPFNFEYPSYAKLEKDSLFFDQIQKNPCWLDLKFNDLNGTIHLSYEQINNEEEFIAFLNDTHRLTYKHTIKAESIEERKIKTQNNVGGLIYDVAGNAASNIQFFLTDSVNHFIRGSLYFNNTPNTDSIAPVVRFVKKDMEHLIKTFKWN